MMGLHIKLYDKGTVPFLLVGTPHTLLEIAKGKVSTNKDKYKVNHDNNN